MLFLHHLMKIILSPTDFSKASLAAVDYASALAQEFRSKLMLIHVYETTATFSEMAYTSITDADQAIRMAADEKLKALKTKIEKKYKNISVDTFLLNGSPADSISGFAKEQGADLIVIGVTGASKLVRLMMGSTASRLVHIAPC